MASSKEFQAPGQGGEHDARRVVSAENSCCNCACTVLTSPHMSCNILHNASMHSNLKLVTMSMSIVNKLQG